MSDNKIAESELILNADGSIYHLHLHPEEIAPLVITVGDPDRVTEVSKHFDRIEFQKRNRECVTHTGYLNNKRISVLSTGMGVNCIDIVINELDALFNIDFKTREIKSQLTAIDIVRIGTSGAIQADLPLDAFVVANYALGLDCLLNYYQSPNKTEENDFLSAFSQYTPELLEIVRPYVTKGSTSLINKFTDFCHSGVTVSCEGFYAPQDRNLRLKPAISHLVQKLKGFSYQGLRLTNMEMESSAIYGLGHALGHRYCSLSAIVANRINGEFTKNSKNTVEKLIQNTLEQLVA